MTCSFIQKSKNEQAHLRTPRPRSTVTLPLAPTAPAQVTVASSIHTPVQPAASRGAVLAQAPPLGPMPSDLSSRHTVGVSAVQEGTPPSQNEWVQKEGGQGLGMHRGA